MAARGSLTIIFPEQVQSVDTSSISSSSSMTTSGESVTTTTEDGQTYSVAFALVAGYKINGADFTPSVNGGIVDSFTNSTVDITAGAAGIDGTLTITVQQSESTTVKTVSSDNLARFKQKCDETYAKIGNIPTVSTELVNLGTLSTSGTLTTDQVTQIGTTTIGVTARASVNGVTRFYERVNISGTTATLVSADDDALHVLTVNLSTRAYTLSDVALGGGGGTQWYQHSISDGAGGYLGFISTSDMDCSGSVVKNDFNAIPKVPQQCYSPDSSGAPNTTVNVFHIEAKSQYNITVYYFSGTTIKSFDFPLATDTVMPL